jgi:peptidoglycan glycosyltransferase
MKVKKLKYRTASVLVLVFLIVSGLSFYTYRLISSGGDWASFRSNGNVYKSGVLTVGTVTDRDDVVLASISKSGISYAEDSSIRKSTLHLVGDKSGNIAYGALSLFSSKLLGYDIISGVYSLSGNGGTVKLAVSSELNEVAYKALNGRSGTVAVMNYKTGEIICMVSSPSFDPENPPTISDDDTSGVYINRAISATFVPGSVYKLVTLAAAIDNISDLYDRDFHCDGKIDIGNGTGTCTSVHGDMKIEDALAKSCNCVFAKLSIELGSEVMEKYAQKLGLTESFYIDGAKVASGNYTREAEGSIALGWSGAGQADDLVAPAAMLRYVSAIANGGNAHNMTFLYGGTSGHTRLISGDTADKIAEMMNYCVYLTYGEEKFPGLELYAKSGTAEVGGNAEPHAWFTGFIRNENCPYAFVVVIENGGWGSSQAGSVANTILQAAVNLGN